MSSITIKNDLCKGCELCISTCPSKLIKLSKKFNSKGLHYVEFTDPDGKCTGCTLCAVICPDAAIEVNKK
ncbi:MAG: 4Fe-4S dicluster domain-containing protein [Spirochaetes bacterium]|nr:4Fe-4S dicluster domain-containing protein [Spirochaetota bacterium]